MYTVIAGCTLLGTFAGFEAANRGAMKAALDLNYGDTPPIIRVVDSTRSVVVAYRRSSPSSGRVMVIP